MKEVDKVKERLAPFGYACSIIEDASTVTLSCSPNDETLEKDKIGGIDFVFPKNEDLVNMRILFPLNFSMSPQEIEKIVREWSPDNVYIAEFHTIEVEFGDNARKFAPAVASSVIRERRRPLVITKRPIYVI